MTLRLLPDRLAICRLPAGESVPGWAAGGPFLSTTRTRDELSIVCAESCVPAGVRTAMGWRALQVEGPLDFVLVGVLLSIAQPLAAAGVSIFCVSTFDTDYVLIQESDLQKSATALTAAGHRLATS